MSMENHIKRLVKDHKTLNEQIDHMESIGNFDDDELHNLKKKRLHLKDELVKLYKIHPEFAPK